MKALRCHWLKIDGLQFGCQALAGAGSGAAGAACCAWRRLGKCETPTMTLISINSKKIFITGTLPPSATRTKRPGALKNSYLRLSDGEPM